MASSLERRRFLMEMGQVVMAMYPGMGMDSNGVVSNAYGRYTPREAMPNLEELLAAMRMVGLEPRLFKFQAYDVTVANPFQGGHVTLQFPAQLVVKSDRYEGEHQLDLVLKSPEVAATEFKSYSR
jgi:hypothetical protein